MTDDRLTRLGSYRLEDSTVFLQYRGVLVEDEVLFGRSRCDIACAALLQSCKTLAKTWPFFTHEMHHPRGGWRVGGDRRVVGHGLRHLAVQPDL